MTFADVKCPNCKSTVFQRVSIQPCGDSRERIKCLCKGCGHNFHIYTKTAVLAVAEE